MANGKWALLLLLALTLTAAAVDPLGIDRTTKRLNEGVIKLPSGATLTIESGATLDLSVGTITLPSGMVIGGLITTDLQRAASNGANGLTITTGGISRTGASADLPLSLLPKGTGSMNIGTVNDASGGLSAVTIGTNLVASGDYSHAEGYFAAATLHGQHAHAAGQFGTTGDAQFTRTILRATTASNSLTALALDGATAPFLVASGKTYCCRITIAARKAGGGGAVAMFIRNLIIENTGGDTAIVATAQTIGTDLNDSALTIGFVADDDADALIINVTGLTDTPINWVAVVEAVEIGS